MFIQTINLENCKNVNRLYQKKFKISRGVLDNWDLPKRRDSRAIMGGNIGNIFCGGIQENENAIFGGDVIH